MGPEVERLQTEMDSAEAQTAQLGAEITELQARGERMRARAVRREPCGASRWGDEGVLEGLRSVFGAVRVGFGRFGRREGEAG